METRRRLPLFSRAMVGLFCPLCFANRVCQVCAIGQTSIARTTTGIERRYILLLAIDRLVHGLLSFPGREEAIAPHRTLDQAMAQPVESDRC